MFLAKLRRSASRSSGHIHARWKYTFTKIRDLNKVTLGDEIQVKVKTSHLTK